MLYFKLLYYIFLLATYETFLEAARNNTNQIGTPICSECYVVLEKLYSNFNIKLDALENKFTNVTTNWPENTAKEFRNKFKVLQKDIDELHLMSLVKKILRLNLNLKENTINLFNNRSELQLQLKNGKEEWEKLLTLLNNGEKMLSNATTLENTQNNFNSEMDSIVKESQNILDYMEELLKLIASIVKEQKRMQLLFNEFHEKVLSIKEKYLKLTNQISTKVKDIQNINNSVKEINQTAAENVNKAQNLKIPKIFKTDTCETLRTSVENLVYIQNHWFNFTTNTEKKIKKTNDKQHKIDEEYNKMKEIENKAESAIKNINQTIQLAHDYKQGIYTHHRNITENIEKNLTDIQELLDTILKEVSETNNTVKLASDTVKNLTSEVDVYKNNVNQTLIKFFEILDELQDLDNTLEQNENKAIQNKNEIKKVMVEMEKAELNYTNYEENFQAMVEEYRKLYNKKKNELNSNQKIYTDNIQNLEHLNKYIKLFDELTFSDNELNIIEKELDNGFEIVTIIEQKKYLEKEVEFIGQIVKSLPKAGELHCKENNFVELPLS